ncbi:MAG TPA: GNAT family N-acetyltransferase [Chloroflexi bacterium]|nr:GNAT family N-acetyltransferase [Chloroflexota bacterium]
MHAYRISETRDLTQIRAYLMRDPDYAAYALGDLEPPLSDSARWFIASQGDRIEGLALVYSGLTPAVLFLMGSRPALRALLAHGVGPDEVLCLARPELEPTLARFYRLGNVHPMYRMRVTARSFQPVEALDGSLPPPARLDETRAGDIRRLLREAALADGRDWHDVAFDPSMMRDGYYYGIYAGGSPDAPLIAAAGTHFVARQAGIAALGNVVVHPRQRNRGLGSRVSSIVTASLLGDGIERVVLNVWQSNKPAIHIYQKLGYEVVGSFIEVPARRRSG